MSPASDAPAPPARARSGLLTWSKVMIVALAATLGACAVNPVQTGMTREQVIASMGAPTGVVPLALGTRLQYSRQPAGQQAFMVDLDAQGQVVQTRQVLVAPEFARIEAGKWTRADVLREFGRPASIDRVANWPHDILTYRWRDIQDMFYWVYVDHNDVVQQTQQGIEYHDRDID